MPRNKEPSLWLSVLKLVAGVFAGSALVWLLLWLADDGTVNTPTEPITTPAKPVGDWGIVTDSPLRGR